MFRRITLLTVLVLVLLGTGSVLAQGPVEPQHTDPYWHAVYWNNTSLSGSPALERNESALDHNWGTGSPAPDVNANGFSARWTRYIDVSPGTYRFTATSDDGIRVWVDDNLIIDQWNDHSATTFTGDVSLSAGHHLVKVEYYENRVDAVARVTWAPVSDGTGGWQATFFNNTSLSGPPAYSRSYESVTFNWGAGSPAPGTLSADHFSARFERTVNLPAGTYRFTVTADDGVRLWVNDHLLVDAWKDQSGTTYTGDLYLSGGAVPIRMEYYERTGAAVARLSWTRTDGGTPQPSPGEVIVDDRDAGFVTGGRAASWRSEPEGYDGRLLWTKNNDRARSNYNWGRWYPSLRPGRYEVFVYVPDRFTTTSRARYWVSHADGYTLRAVDQSANGNRWVSLGTYRFNGTRGDYVSLSDVTYELYLSRLIAWDAMKWVPR